MSAVQYRRLGRSDLEVSEIGFGCWEVGGEYGSFDTRQFARAVNQALDIGINLFDTAWGYGEGASEAILAEALGTRRSEAILCTKIGIYRRPDGSFYRDSSRETLVDTVDRSLRALRTDAIDLLLIHWPDRSRGFEEPMSALTEIVTSGKARYIGVSNFHSADLSMCADLAPIVANQVGYNLFDRRWEHEMFPTAERLGIGVMAYGPLAHGLLAGEVRPGVNFAENDWRRRGQAFGQPIFEGANLVANAAVVASLARIAAREAVTLPQLALAWVLGSPVVATALTGVRNPKEILENASASSVELSDASKRDIGEAMGAAAGLTSELPR